MVVIPTIVSIFAPSKSLETIILKHPRININTNTNQNSNSGNSSYRSMSGGSGVGGKHNSHNSHHYQYSYNAEYEEMVLNRNTIDLLLQIAMDEYLLC